MVNHKSVTREGPVLDHTAPHHTWMASTFDPSHDVIPNWPRSFTVNAFPARGGLDTRIKRGKRVCPVTPNAWKTSFDRSNSL